MNKDSAAELFVKFQAGKATPEEQLLIEKWLLQYRVDEPGDLSDEDIAQLKHEVWTGIAAQTPSRILRPWKKLAVACSILLMLSTGLVLYFNQPEKSTALTQNIKPGSYGATLTLSNGQQITLNDKAKGKLAIQGNVHISKTAEGQIAYDGENKNLIYNTLTTKRKEQYDLILADGTHVWLNASSSLRFPAAFSGKDRVIELTGEAYFEVKRDESHPFIVRSEGQSVEVLGTKFDVNSYPEEEVIKTTLLEGKVKVSNANDQLVIAPGQQAESKAGSLSVVNVDAQASVDWVNGEFQLNDQTLEEIMRKVARWYDLEVVYTDADKTRRYGGSTSRFENINAVLEKLELTGSVKFKVEGRRVTVSK